MKRLAWRQLLILFVASVALFTNLGGSRLWDRDEPRNAGCAWEMAQRGDWVTPVFNARLRDQKPVLLYWLIISSYSLLGVNEFAARLPSALLGLGTVIVTFHIGRRLFSESAALWGALILSTTLMFDVVARAATHDSALIFFCALALLVFVQGTFRRRESNSDDSPPQLKKPGQYFPTSWTMVATMYAIMGIGVLAKGLVALVLPTAVIGMFLLIVRLPTPNVKQPAASETRLGRAWRVIQAMSRPFWPPHFLRTCWSMRPITAICLVVTVAGPWYCWVGLRTEGLFLQGFFLKEHFGRATTALENHDGGLWYYPVSILIGFFPWSVFAAPVLISVVRRLRRRDPWSAGYLLMACWVGVYVVLFTVAQTKLPSYITPCYPALALMTGCFIFHWSEKTSLVAPWWPRLATLSLGLVGAVMLIAVPLVAARWLKGDQWLASIGLIPLLGAVCLWRLIGKDRPRAAAVTFAVMASLFGVAMFGWGAHRVSQRQQSHILFAAIGQRSENPRIASFGCLESSWVFYSKRPIVELDLKHSPSGAAATDLRQEYARQWDPPPRIDVAGFFAADGEAFLITTRDALSAVRQELPDDVEVIAQAPYFLKDQTLVVLGRVQEAQVSTSKPSGSTDLR